MKEDITQTNCIICGDCRDQLARIPDGSVDLIYLDPPFFSGKNYEIIWGDGAEIRSFEDTKFYMVVCECGEEFPAHHKFCAKCGASYKDAKERRSSDIEVYLDWLRPRLERCRDVLKDTGSIYVHLDHHAVHYIKVIMDDIFKDGDFNTEITWRRCGSKGNAKMFANNSDYILFYSKNKSKATFNIQYGEYSKSTLNMYKFDDHDGRGLYGSYDISAPGGSGYKYDLGYGEKQPSGGYRWKKETMLKRIEEGVVILKRGRVPRQKRYLSDMKGVPFDNVWTDIENVKSPIYPTEKPEALLERIIKASSNPGDVVLDPFCGCGTAVSVAQKLGRKWIGIDVSPTSCKLMINRLRDIKGDWIRINEADIIDLPRTCGELRKMDPFEFQNLVIAKLDGKQNSKKVGDHGIDGWTYKTDDFGMRHKQIGFDAAVQVKRSGDVPGKSKQSKQSTSVGTPTVDRLVGAMAGDTDNTDGKHGIIVAFSFSSNAYTQVKNLKTKAGITIELITVKELFNCK